MALSKERMGEIALLSVLKDLEEEGIQLQPKEVKREIINRSRKLEISVKEMAEFAEMAMATIYEKTLANVKKIAQASDAIDPED